MLNRPEYLNVPFVNIIEQHRRLKSALLNACEAVFDHGQFILGSEVADFEQRFADYCGVKYAIGVDNGTNALLLALRALGIGPGDEVITAANSFIASAASIALAGAKPVLVDVLEDFTMDSEKIESAITSRTKAIMPVHLTGRPARMADIIDISERYSISIIEDAAQAVGASIDGKRVGSFGRLGCFSFHPLKILNALGDGGIITTNELALRDYILKARNHGLRSRDECEFWSYNSRLDTVQAAMLLVKMEYLPQWIEERRKIAAFYHQMLNGIVTVPQEETQITSVYQTFVILCEHREELINFLGIRGIETKIHYPLPIHWQRASASLGYKQGDFPMTELQSAKILSLPIYPELTMEQMQWVTDSIISFYAMR